MAGEPLDRLEIQISSSSTDAVDKVNALASALERLKKASSLKGIENTAEKIKAIGDSGTKLSVEVDRSSVSAVDNLIKKVEALKSAIDKVNSTSIKVKGLTDSGKAKPDSGSAESDIRKKLEVSKLDSSIKKVEGAIDDLRGKYKALQDLQGKGNTDTQSRNAAELAKVSALLEEQQRLYDSLIEKKKKYASTGAASDVNASGTTDVQSTAVDKVTQRVGLLQRALAWVRQEWSMFDAAALKATSEGTASLERMKKSIFDNVTAWSKIRSAASSAFDGVKEKIAAAAAQGQKFATVLKIGIPVVGTIVSVLRGLVGIFGKIVSGALQFARTIAGAALNGVKKLASGLKSIGGHVLNYVTKPFQRAIGFIENFKKKLVSVAFYRLVRTALKMITDGFKEGIENLYYFSSLTESQFKPAMDGLASSSLYLKNSLGAMAAPLIQAVAPAVNYLIDLFVSLLNVINMVFSVLGGRTYTKALKTSAKYADDLDKSLGGGASSAKELQRYLIGIDQLTIMPDEPNRGGGGGGGLDLGSQYEEMFEEVPLPDWVLNIKDAIDAGDWMGAGELLAEKVNGLIDKLKDNAKNWGRNIGEAIQNGIELSLGFIRKVDIEGIGQSITTLIGNALNNINPRDLGAIIASGIKSAFRFAHGLLQGYTGPEIGTYLSNVVNGWFAELRRDKGWKKAGQDLNKVILGIINGVANFLENLNTDSIEKDLKDFFGEIEWGDIWASLERVAKVAADKVPWKDMLDGLWRFAANVLVFLRSSVLGIPSNQASQPWRDLEDKLSRASETINWADIISGLIAFVGDLTTTIKGAIPADGWSGIWDSVKQTLLSALGFDSWDDLKTEFQDKVFTVITTAFGIAGDAIYEWLTASGSLVGDFAANVFFPDRYQVDKATQNFIGYLEAGSLDAAQAQINAMVSNGKITVAEAEKLAAEHGYSYANGLLSSLPNVNGAADTITKTVNSSLDKIDNDVEVIVNANKTPAFDAAVEQIAETNDKNATLSATVNNTNASSSETVQNLWNSVENKTATLIAVVRDASPKARQSVQEAWESVEDKNVTLKATIRDANPKALESIKSAWGDISDKTATLNARVVDAMSSTRTKMLDAWDELKTKTVTLTARASNPNEGTFTTLLSTWTSLQSKTVTVTAKGTINDSVNNAKNALNNISNKSATVTLYGSLTNAFNSAKNAYDSLKSKTVSVTVNGRSSGVGGRATGGVFYGGKWHDVAGYAGGGRPRSAQLFYANENGIPELIGRIGANTAVMNNGQIVSSVASGVYRAVSAAMGGLGNYFANIANGMSRIPDALRDITPVSPQPITLERDMSVYQQMEAGGYNRYGSDGVSVRDQESTENIINAIMAMGRQIISAINENGGDFYLDGQMVGTRTTEVQNRQSRIYGRPVAST